MEGWLNWRTRNGKASNPPALGAFPPEVGEARTLLGDVRTELRITGNASQAAGNAIRASEIVSAPREKTNRALASGSGEAPNEMATPGTLSGSRSRASRIREDPESSSRMRSTLDQLRLRYTMPCPRWSSRNANYSGHLSWEPVGEALLESFLVKIQSLSSRVLRAMGSLSRSSGSLIKSLKV